MTSLVSEGQRLLLEVSETSAEIARRVGVSKPIAHRWRTGAKTPGPTTRDVLREAYGIDPRAWDMRPKTEADEEDEAEDEVVEEAASAAPGTIADVDRLIGEVRRERTADLSIAQKARLAESEMRLLATRARIEREQERAVFERERLERERAMFEAKVVTEHPKWKRIKRHLLEQFAGDTAALRKIELAILEAEAG